MSIQEICKKYGISNYTINDDKSIDVDGSVEIPYMAKYSDGFKERCSKYLDLITTKGMLGFFKSEDGLRYDTNLFLASTVSFSKIIFVVPFSNLTKTYTFIVPINNDLIGQIERGEVTNLRYYFEEAGMEEECLEAILF